MPKIASAKLELTKNSGRSLKYEAKKGRTLENVRVLYAEMFLLEDLGLDEPPKRIRVSIEVID